MFLKIVASQTNRLLFRNWADRVTKSARTGDDKDSGLLLCCETSCNIAMLCSGTSASLQLKTTRFGQHRKREDQVIAGRGTHPSAISIFKE